jgi:lipoprotein-anchoring transpeptidase ErfK/SrfK
LNQDRQVELWPNCHEADGLCSHFGDRLYISPSSWFPWVKEHEENSQMNWKTKITGGIAGILAAGMMLAGTATASLAGVVAHVDLSSQTMRVTVDGRHYASWKISSGRKGYGTPTGTWRPKWTTKMHYSRKYHNSPIPYSVFYHGGYAVHGTNYVSKLGRPASHGCIRLHTANARTFYNLVNQYGRKNTLIRVSY